MREEDFYDHKTRRNFFGQGDLVRFTTEDSLRPDLVGYVMTLHYGEKTVYLNNTDTPHFFTIENSRFCNAEKHKGHPFESWYQAKFCDWDSFEVLETAKDSYGELRRTND